jgi:general secretion pathway protein L
MNTKSMADSQTQTLGNFDFARGSKSRAAPKAKSRTVLQLHIPDGWPSSTSMEEPRFRWALWDGVYSQYGVAPLREIARGEEIVAVVPMQRATFLRVKIPAGNARKIEKMLPFLIEDQIASSPEDVVAVLVDRRRPDEESLVVTADRAWVAQARGELEVQGFPPTRMVVESELLDRAKSIEGWTVVRTASGGFAHFPDGEAIALDGTNDETSLNVPPMALTLVVDERNALGEIPPEVQILTAENVVLPDVSRWSQLLSVRVVAGGEWRPERIDVRTRNRTNLITRERNDGVASAWIGPFKWPIIAIVSVFCLHAVATIVDWMRLHHEASSIRTEMTSRFRTVFPDAKAIVDPMLQMSRSVADLRRASGEADSTDFVPLLAQAAPRLAAAGIKPQKIRYEKGQLQLELTVAAGESKETVETKLQVEGLRVQVDSVAGAVATVRITSIGKGT